MTVMFWLHYKCQDILKKNKINEARKLKSEQNLANRGVAAIDVSKNVTSLFFAILVDKFRCVVQEVKALHSFRTSFEMMTSQARRAPSRQPQFLESVPI